MTATDFAKQLSRFLSEYLPHERNVSPNTLSAYRDAFVQYIDYMHTQKGIAVERLCLKDLTRQNVLGYLNWILDERHCSPATRNYRLAAICSFAQYMQYEDVGRLSNWQQILSVKALKTEKRTINYLTVDGIKLLLEQPDTETVKGRRDMAMLALMYDTAARVQEIVDLTPGNVRADSKPYTIRLVGKGRKSRIVPLMEEQVRILKCYMDEHRLHEPEKRMSPLFFNSRREKLTRAGVGFILDSYVQKARRIHPELIPDKVSCHSLRHSKAMHLLQAGVNLVYIRDILGHTSISTTDVYARADSKQKREALEKAYVDVRPDDKKERIWEKDKNLLEWLQGLK